MIGRHARTIVDLGTGDGGAVVHAARRHPEALVIGVDTNASGLAEVSRRAARPPRKGGLPNTLFLAAEASAALALLRGRVDQVYVTLPWGSLLRAVVEGEKEFAHAVMGAL